MRMILLGTAGTGKTCTVKTAVAHTRLVFKNYDAALMVAHTGVAAANMGSGAATIN